MKKIISTTLLMTTALLLSLGCASTSSLQNAPLHAGKARVFNASFDWTLKAAQEAAVSAGLEIESTSQTDDGGRMIIAKKASSVWSWGELVRLLVLRKGVNATEVRVYTKKRVAINVTAKGDYSDAVFSNMEIALGTQ